jgi:hypothetical protein
LFTTEAQRRKEEGGERKEERGENKTIDSF